MDFEEVDVANVQKLNELAMSTPWRPVSRRPRPLCAEFPIILPVLGIGVALGVSCFASGHPLAGLWLGSASLSWAFLIGAGNASECYSRASEADDEAPTDVCVGGNHAKG